MSTISPYVGNGVTRQFDITFSYSDAASVHVRVDGADVPFSLISPARVETATAPTSGALVEVYRKTTVDTAAVGFSDGSLVLAADLNNAVGQARLRSEELGSEVQALSKSALRVASGQSSLLIDDMVGQDGKVLSILNGRGRWIANDAAGAAQSALDANSAKVSAQSSASASALALSSFYSSFLGAYADDTAANAGAVAKGVALTNGLQYTNTATLKLRTYNAGAWSDYDVTAQSAAAATAANASSAAASSAVTGVLSSTPSSLPYEVTAITLGAAGSGATVSGEFALSVSGGPLGHQATVIVSGGAVTAVRILNPGISVANSAPTYTLPAIAGLTGATAPTATVGVIPVNRVFWAPSADGAALLQWGNNAGSLATAPFGGTQSSIQLTYDVADLFPDTLFAMSALRGLGLSLNGRDYLTGSAGDVKVWSASYSHAFGVGAYQIPAGTTPGRWRAWFDSPMAEDEGVTTGSVIRPCLLTVAPASATVTVAARFIDSAGAFVGLQVGTATSVATGRAKAVQVNAITVPSGAAGVEIWAWCASALLNVLDVGCAVGSDAKPLIRNKWRGYASRQLSTNAAAVDTKIAAISKAVDTVTVGNRTDSVAITLGSQVLRTEADGFTGFGQSFSTPATFSTNGCWIYGLCRGSTTKLWTKVRVILRTHATDPANPASTVVAIGELRIDPNTSSFSSLFVPWRDPVTNALKTVTQADLLAQYGVIYQAWVDDTVKATTGEQRATAISGASKLTSYYVTTADAKTGTWAPYVANPTFAVAAVLFDTITQSDVYYLSDAAKADMAAGLTIPPLMPWVDTGRLRKFRSFSYKRQQPVPETGLRHVFAFVGDSWSTSTGYFTARLCKSLIAKLGDGGVGWFGFGFTSGVMAGDARGLYFLDSALTGWTSNYHAGSTSPNISDARSSTAAATFRISNVTGATHPALSNVLLHFTGTADGVIQWRWNGGSWSASTNVQGGVGVQQTLSLTGFPTAALSNAAGRANTLDIQVISGSVILGGVDFQSATDGIVFHKLGASGAKASDWGTSLGTQWQAGIAALGINSAQILLGVNDQAGAVASTTFAAQMGAIATALRGAIPTVDLLFVMPPETPAGYATTMASLSTALRAQSVTSKAAFLTLAPSFGDTPSEYAYGGAYPLFLSDAAHPNTEGAAIVSGEIERTLLWR
ncbi:MAG: hypothetical protein KGP14_11710 [Betaproteobacteria bacterium]|nr:hypothetical protein [Betaproteobacteria bacterium]